jgi:hypothetical protein
VQANITVSASEINLLSTLIVLGTMDTYILPCQLTGTGMSTLWVELATRIVQETISLQRYDILPAGTAKF